MINKKKLFLCLVIALFSRLTYAQSTDAPTKQDALDFINKVLKEFPQPYQYNQMGNTESYAMLDGCHLIFIYNYKSLNADLGGNSYYYNTSSTSIDLSSVYLKDDVLYSNVSGDLFLLVNTHDIKYRNGKEKYPSPDTKSVIPKMFVFSVIGDHHDNPNFTDNNYHDRFLKALDFLIKACGGGAVKAGPVEKF